jgi:OOP family OmpA-OmpF porin
MKQLSNRIPGALALAAAFIFAGCNVSFSTGNLKTLKSNENIVVTAERPAPPPKPKPKPKPKPERKAKVVNKKIEITEKVMFEVNKAVIQEQSFELLNDVAAVIKENPHIKEIRIEGHTDADGSDSYNKDLSQKRADSVKTYLVEAGVDEAILDAVGYGEEKPIADNDTEAGKEKNRRVEFNIVKQEAN